jgi:hypothetical protein
LEYDSATHSVHLAPDLAPGISPTKQAAGA